jgi:hypothetical protein
MCCMSGAERERSAAGIHVQPYITRSREGAGQQRDNPDSRPNTQGGQICNGFAETKTGSDNRRAANKMK